MARWSNELSEDAIISIGDTIAQEAAYAMAYKEDLCGFNGDGTSTYGGIVGITSKIIDGNYAASAKDAASGHDTISELDLDDLKIPVSVLPLYARPNAKWYMSQTFFDYIMFELGLGTTALGAGNTIANLQEGYQPRLFGYPVVVSQVLPTALTDISNTVMLLFGDLRLSTMMGTRRGVTAKVSEDRYMEYDQTAALFTERFDINNANLGDGTTPGPIIALVAE
jgi:HK97 family phage major capsid protein